MSADEPLSTSLTHPDARVLVGDVGGTNARFGLATSDGVVDPVAYLATAEHGSFEEAVRAFLDRHSPPRPLAGAAVCGAGPVMRSADGPLIRLTNAAWEISGAALRRATGVRHPVIVNDFAALARGVPLLGPGCLRRMTGGTDSPAPVGPIAVLGPGTGLGVAALVPGAGGDHAVLTSEGGHVDLAPGDEREVAILGALMRRFAGHVSAERVLSGPGLVNLHEALSELAGDAATPGPTTPAEILDLAQHAGNARALEAVRLFTGWLGAFAGNVALTFAASGGVYLAGGILPRLGPLLDEALFRRRFEGKGRMMPLLEAVPVWMVAGGEPALRGLVAEAFGAAAATSAAGR